MKGLLFAVLLWSSALYTASMSVNNTDRNTLLESVSECDANRKCYEDGKMNFCAYSHDRSFAICIPCSIQCLHNGKHHYSKDCRDTCPRFNAADFSTVPTTPNPTSPNYGPNQRTESTKSTIVCAIIQYFGWIIGLCVLLGVLAVLTYIRFFFYIYKSENQRQSKPKTEEEMALQGDIRNMLTTMTGNQREQHESMTEKLEELSENLTRQNKLMTATLTAFKVQSHASKDSHPVQASGSGTEDLDQPHASNDSRPVKAFEPPAVNLASARLKNRQQPEIRKKQSSMSKKKKGQA